MALSPVKSEVRRTRRSAFTYGSGRITTALTTVKIALFAPMPSARVAIAMAARRSEKAAPREPPVLTQAIHGGPCRRKPHANRLIPIHRVFGPLSPQRPQPAPLPGRCCANPNSPQIIEETVRHVSAADSVKVLDGTRCGPRRHRHGGFLRHDAPHSDRGRPTRPARCAEAPAQGTRHR